MCHCKKCKIKHHADCVIICLLVIMLAVVGYNCSILNAQNIHYRAMIAHQNKTFRDFKEACKKGNEG